jgi:CubicO group peptidase (beta-lactamase class C family)
MDSRPCLLFNFNNVKDPKMKTYTTRFLLLCILLIAGFIPASAAPAPAGKVDFAALDEAITAQMSKHGLPGVSIAVIEGDEVVYLKGYGTAGAGRSMTPQTQMFIGSQSKSFTALAIAQLTEQGKIDLNAAVQTYISWFHVADAEASRQITVNHLLHHSSGLSDAGYSVALPDGASYEQAVRSLAKAQITAPVGSKHQYFNLGYNVLSYLIELTSGESYAGYLQAHIFAPLEMSSTTARPETARELSWGYSRFFGFAFPMRQPVREHSIGSGYIVSTAEDMARYTIAMKDQAGGLVSPQMARKIFAPSVGGYGMGWYISNGGKKISHGGANETFRTDLNIYPTQDRAFVLLTNQGHQVDHFVSASQLSSRVEAIVLGQAPLTASVGWSVRWAGWGLGVLCLGLVLLHTSNFLALRGWRARTRRMTSRQIIWDIAISFLIPTVILVIVFSQLKSFYGDRFNLVQTLALFRFVFPDVFFLMLVGIFPDYIQGMIKLFLLVRQKFVLKRAEQLPAHQ